MCADENNKICDLGEYRELRANTLRAVSAPPGEVHRQQLVRAQLFSFSPKRRKQRRPVLMRNPLALSPLLDGGPIRSDISGHRCECFPAAKKLVERAHAPKVSPDELSGQGPPMIPVTAACDLRTISPMGRGVTPVKFRSEMAERLKAARIMARYETQKRAADALGVGLDRYEKWESGRTPVPAQYIGAVCELYGVDANYLFSVNPRAAAASKRTA